MKANFFNRMKKITGTALVIALMTTGCAFAAPQPRENFGGRDGGPQMMQPAPAHRNMQPAPEETTVTEINRASSIARSPSHSAAAATAAESSRER